MKVKVAKYVLVFHRAGHAPKINPFRKEEGLDKGSILDWKCQYFASYEDAVAELRSEIENIADRNGYWERTSSFDYSLKRGSEWLDYDSKVWRIHRLADLRSEVKAGLNK